MRLHRWSTREGDRGIRAFAHVYDKAEGHMLLSGRFEGYLFSGAQHTGLALEFDDEDAGLQVFAGVAHLFDVWLTAGSPRLAQLAYLRWQRSVPNVDIAEVKFHGRAVWWTLWHDKHSWSSGTPRWRKGSFHWWDWLTGKPVYRSELVEGPMVVTVPMPEGGYQATVKLSRDTWTRRRWPWPQVRNGYDIDILPKPGAEHGYIPIPGKGENSWDCGPDGIFSQSGSARTVEEAIGHLVASALRDRRRYGGAPDYAEPIT